MLVNVSWLYWLQVAGDMASEVASVDRGRVESVIVTWGEVDDHVVKLVTFGSDAVYQLLYFGIDLVSVNFAGCTRFFVIRIPDITKHEFIEAV